MLKLISKSTKELSAKNIKEICLLKDSQWKFGLKSQLNYFKNNIKPYDLHNCFYITSHLVGYTLLRRRRLEISNKKLNYLLFDALIIKKDFRKKKISSLMMLFNNNVIKEKKKISFLTCTNELLKFYEKFFWKKISNKKFKIIDHPFNTNGMFFNYPKNLISMKSLIKIYINR